MFVRLEAVNLVVTKKQLTHHYDMKHPNFEIPLYGVDEHNTKIVAFFF